jgi:hypothetical protein
MFDGDARIPTTKLKIDYSRSLLFEDFILERADPK